MVQSAPRRSWIKDSVPHADEVGADTVRHARQIVCAEYRREQPADHTDGDHPKGDLRLFPVTREQIDDVEDERGDEQPQRERDEHGVYRVPEQLGSAPNILPSFEIYSRWRGYLIFNAPRVTYSSTPFRCLARLPAARDLALGGSRGVASLLRCTILWARRRHGRRARGRTATKIGLLT